MVGRTWWAHFEFTRINIEPTILRKKFEELRTLRALPCFGETDQTQIAKLFLTQLFEGVVPTVPFANRYEGVVDTLV